MDKVVTVECRCGKHTYRYVGPIADVGYAIIDDYYGCKLQPVVYKCLMAIATRLWDEMAKQ